MCWTWVDVQSLWVAFRRPCPGPENEKEIGTLGEPAWTTSKEEAVASAIEIPINLISRNHSRTNEPDHGHDL
jgi:hypothetical protein